MTEVEELRAEVAHWKANHANMVARNALLSQRPDLPVDRIPAHSELVRLQLGGQPVSLFSDNAIMYAMGEVMADAGQPCTDEYLLKLGSAFLTYALIHEETEATHDR